MPHHLTDSGPEDRKGTVDCGADPVASLVEMFVGKVQGKRIAAGQCPVRRPVFLKPHGVAHGVFRIRPDLPANLRVGVFAGGEYPTWVRFSSDTLPTRNDYTTTVGVGIKLFGVPGKKIFGAPDDVTLDFILQNMDVFFVNTAKDMCEFTQSGVIGGSYDPYLATHDETAKILNDMAKPVGSVLATRYWSCLPFSFGPDQYVKYTLEPCLDVPLPSEPPADPTYLAADLKKRLAEGEIRFRFCVQLRTRPDRMPLDMATVPWLESESPPVHVADLILPQQDVTVRGQAEYGENLSYNIWRVTEEHRPQGSIADARRAVYEASAQVRRDANGVPTGEPSRPKPVDGPGQAVDSVIVRAAIHPAIGIARVGDSATGFYIGPQVTEPALREPGIYRDATGALKREAAEFRVYGYNAAGEVVAELTADNADVVWTAHLVNRKADWYQFQLALDIPEAAGKSMPRRNPLIQPPQRGSLVIDPGPRSIGGKSTSGGQEHAFDTGKFKDTVVPLGEIRTDAAGRLLVLGGHGKSGTPSGAPIYIPEIPDSFNNADDWYDDTSDGPVTAQVSIDGRPIPVQHAWVVVAPPNYGTDVVGWRTMHDLLIDTYVRCGWLPMPEATSFSRDILPFLRRLSNLQWVNKGFAAMFGKGGPMDFEDSALVARLARAPSPPERGTPSDVWAELRQVIVNSFRPFQSPSYQPRTWPWLYGDAYGSSTVDSPRNVLDLPAVQEVHLQRWAAGDFVNDWDPAALSPPSIDKVPLAEQPAMLDKAALHFCVADAFHPGCELTWNLRHTSMFERPFRVRLRPDGQAEADYGKALTPAIALRPDGPLYGQVPGSLTRWMALPWQGDTAFCRSGYPPSFDPYVPTFWPARVPNQVLTEDDYKTVMNTATSREARLVAFNTRPPWTRGLKGGTVEVMMQMVKSFAHMGVVEARRGIDFDPDFPSVIFVETIPEQRARVLKDEKNRMRSTGAPPTPAQQAGWEDEAQMEAFAAARIRFTRTP